MDQMVQHLSEPEGSRTASYSLPEIWQFPVTNNANATSFGECMNMNMSSMNLDMNNGGNVGMAMMNREHDPMVMDHCKQGISLTSHANAMKSQNESDIKRMKTANEPGESKQEREVNSGNAADQTPKLQEPPKQDYIHVRARRGQATDSHSLAERARREKISERMKILQDLVPGCNKVIGKALVLDEIINYIQSLQRQVEFLSMKLETVNSRVPPGIEGFPSKEFAQQQAFDASSLGFSSQAARDYGGTSPEWLHMQLGGGFERTS